MKFAINYRCDNVKKLSSKDPVSADATMGSMIKKQHYCKMLIPFHNSFFSVNGFKG